MSTKGKAEGVQPGKPLWKSIKLKTLLLVLLMVSPLVLLGIAGTLYYQGVIRQNINGDVLKDAKTLAATTPEYMNTSQLYLQSVADRPLVINAIEENDRPFLHLTAVYANQTERIDDVFFTDSKGTIIESSPGLTSLIGSNSTDHAYVDIVLRTGNPVIGDAEQGSSLMPVVPVGVPVKDGNGTVIGVMVGRVDLDEYEKMVVGSFLKPEQIFYMVNKTGHVMMHENHEYAMTMRDFTAVPGVQDALRGETGVAEYYNPIENQSRLEAYAPVEPMGWGVIVALPVDVAYQPVWNATWMAAGIIVLFSLIATGSGWYIGNSITAPITRMSQATGIAFTDDDYQKLLPLDREDEIGDLARSFSEIVDTIKKEELERERAEEALRMSEAKYRTLFDSIDEGFCIVEMIYDAGGKPVDYRFLEVNPAFEKQTGLKDATGKRMRELVPAHEEHWFETYGNIVATGKPRRFINAAKPLMGGWYDVYAFQIGGRKSNQVAILFNDITERKRTEEAVRESKAKLEAVFSSMNDGVIIFGPDGSAINANDAAARFHRFTDEKDFFMHLSSYADMFDVRHPDGTPLTIENWPVTRALRGETLSNYEMIVTRRDTGESWVGNYSAAPIWDIEGNIIAAVVTMRDVTERKRAEEALTEAKVQAELYLDLMGHDINNMHQIALGYLELARGMHPEAGESEFLDKSIEVLQRSARLIRNVRKLQKLHDGVFQIETVDVAKVLADVQREYGSVPDKAITLNLNGCDHCRIHANELLHDVFANLVGNAIKHTGDHADITIDLDFVEDNGHRYCRVMVEDNGPGIRDDFKDKIFKRILKGDSKTKGIGLGLYLVKSLVESYDGRVWVEDRVTGDYTKGARFVVLLPAI